MPTPDGPGTNKTLLAFAHRQNIRQRSAPCEVFGKQYDEISQMDKDISNIEGRELSNVPSKSAVAVEWSVEDLCSWATRIGLPGQQVESLWKHSIDGRALFELTQEELRNELRFPLGPRKLFLRSRAALISALRWKTDTVELDNEAAPSSPNGAAEEISAQDTCLKRCYDKLRRACRRRKFKQGPLCQLFTFKDTVILPVLNRPELALSAAIYVGIIFLRVNFQWYQSFSTIYEEELAYHSQLQGFMNWALTFYLVFYNNVGYQRWLANWELTQTAYGRLNDLNLLVPAYMMINNPKEAQDVLRFVHAYHHIIYFSTMGLPEETALRACVDRHLITTGEMHQLQLQDCSTGMRLLVWATQTIALADISPIHASQLNEIIVLLRRNMAYIWSYDDQLLPFVYVHLSNFLMLLVAVSQSILSACSAPNLYSTHPNWVIIITSCLAHLIWIFFLLSLREVSIIVADPFSTGRNGINIERYLDLHLVGSSKLAKYHHVLPDPSQDPGFPSAYKDFTPFRQRKVRNVDYLRSRDNGLIFSR